MSSQGGAPAVQHRPCVSEPWVQASVQLGGESPGAQQLGRQKGGPRGVGQTVTLGQGRPAGGETGQWAREEAGGQGWWPGSCGLTGPGCGRS